MLNENELQKIDTDGWVKLEIPALWKDLLQNAYELLEQRKFKTAQLNQGMSETAQKTEIRNDRIHWMEPNQPYNDAETQFADLIKELQEDLKNYFRVSLIENECHYAVYPAGHFYKKHSDQSDMNNKRFFSFVYYLNENWHTSDGGQLVIYNENNPALELKRITPTAGTLILFKSHIEHEVLPSAKKRFSVTGWMRTR